MTTTAYSFSLHRIAQLYRFNAPWLRKQLFIYLAVSLATSLLYILGEGHIWQSPVNSICNLALGVMFILSPLVFIKGGDCRIVERLIPVSAAEKFVFHISWLVVIIPVCFLLPWISERIVSDDFRIIAGSGVDVELGMSTPPVFEWIQHISALAAMFTCYFCVVYPKTGRQLKGVIFGFLVIIVFNIVGAVFAAAEAFMVGYNSGMEGLDADVDQQELVMRVADAMYSNLTYAYIILGVFIAYSLLMLTLSYRSIHRRNL